MFSTSTNIGEIVDIEYSIDDDGCIDIKSVTIEGNSVIGLLSAKQWDDLEYIASQHYHEFAKFNDFLE